MASIDTLPPDQRAVLDLVLQRGRSYDDIARLLAIDRAGVRARALAAFDALGPDTGLAPEARALITDYLLGQLPPRVAEQTRDRLATSPYERAWARVLASELAPVSSKPLPEIPEGTARSKAPAAEATAATEATNRSRSAPTARRLPRATDRPSSRLGGAIFLLVGTIVVIVVVVVLLLVLSSGSSKHSSDTTAAQTGTTTAAQGPTTGTTGVTTGTTGATAGTTGTTATGTTGTTTTGATGTTSAKIVAQINLDPPSGTGNAKGASFVVKAGTAFGIIVEAQGLAPNSHNAYAVWLSNSPTDSVRVGFVNTPVGKNGKLQTEGPLPSNAAHYKNLLLTLETSANPKTPGQVVLQGTLKGLT
jgi:hypothetical protein